MPRRRIWQKHNENRKKVFCDLSFFKMSTISAYSSNEQVLDFYLCKISPLLLSFFTDICSSPCSTCHRRQRMGCCRSQSWRCSSSPAPPWGWWSPRWPPPGRPWRWSARSTSPTSVRVHSPACPWLKTIHNVMKWNWLKKYERRTSRKPCQRGPCCPLDCRDRLDWSHQCRTLWKQNVTDQISLWQFCPGWK